MLPRDLILERSVIKERGRDRRLIPVPVLEGAIQ